MKRVLMAAGLAIVLTGCEVFEESYLIEQEVLIDEQGVRVTNDLEEDFFGASWFQFRAYNANSFSVCVQVTLDANSYTSGHSLGGSHLVGPGQSVDVGYINNPSDYYVSTRVTNPNANGACY